MPIRGAGVLAGRGDVEDPYAARSDRFADVNATFHEICNNLYAEVVRALVDGLFTQWV